MEKYEDMDIRLGHINAKELADVCEVNVQRDDDGLIIFERSQTNFNFGAEILSTNMNMKPTATTSSAATATPATSEPQPKANSEIKTKTLPQMGEQEIGANQNAKKFIDESEQSLQQKQIEKSFSEVDEDDDDDEDENEDYKSRYK